MQTIQTVGLEILGGTPKQLYIFCGTEYGIKMKYIEVLEKLYGYREEYEHVNDILHLMRTKRMIPLPPKVYVVRYDDSFLSSLSVSTAGEIEKTKIVGTIVMIYEGTKYLSKLDKYLPNYVVSIDPVSEQFMKSYLRNDFPGLPDTVIDVSSRISTDYYQAKLMCSSLSHISEKTLRKLHSEDIASLFGHTDESSDKQVQLGLAARDFSFLCNAISCYDGTPDSIIYSMMSALLELEKVMCTRGSSPLKEYVVAWTIPDIYYMFKHCYIALKQLRSLSVADPYCIVYFLASIAAQFPIPDPENFLGR